MNVTEEEDDTLMNIDDFDNYAGCESVSWT